MATLYWRGLEETSHEEVDESHPLPVQDVTPQTGTLFAGTRSLTTTAAFALTATSQPCRTVLVQNDHDNTIDVLIGTESAQVYQLTPGDSVSLAVENVNEVFAKNVSSTTQSVNWLAVS